MPAAILASAARLLKPGRRLVYATCSLLDVENEDIARNFTAEHERDFQVLPAQDALARAHVDKAESLVRGDFMRLWPHRHGTDGMFLALLRKKV